MPPHIYVSRIYVSPPLPAQLEAKPIKQDAQNLAYVARCAAIWKQIHENLSQI